MLNDTTTGARAAIADLYNKLGDPVGLSKSLEASASYLESCAEKHTAPTDLRYYANGVRACERIAGELRVMKSNNVALRRYRNVVLSLDEAQIAAFAKVAIDYQARLGSQFIPTSAIRYLADLTAIAFALEALEGPTCLIGVGGGLVPRHRMQEVA